MKASWTQWASSSRRMRERRWELRPGMTTIVVLRSFCPIGQISQCLCRLVQFLYKLINALLMYNQETNTNTTFFCDHTCPARYAESTKWNNTRSRKHWQHHESEEKKYCDSRNRLPQCILSANSFNFNRRWNETLMECTGDVHDFKKFWYHRPAWAHCAMLARI